MLINALDFSSLQAAIDAAEPGDRIYVPGVKRWTAPSSGGWSIRKSLELFGDGAGTDTGDDGTTFVANGSATTDDIFTVSTQDGPVGSVLLRDFKIKKAAGSRDGANGIRCVTPSSDLQSLRLERLFVIERKGHGIVVDGSGDGRVRSFAMTQCSFSGNDGLGLSMKKVPHALIVNSFFNGNGFGGVLAENNGLALYVSGVDGYSSNGSATQGQFRAVGCSILRIDACHFERISPPGAGDTDLTIAVDFADGGGALVIGGSFFTQKLETSNRDARGTSIRARSAVSGPITILGNRHNRVKDLAVVDNASQVGVIFPQYDDAANGTFNGAPGNFVVPAMPNAIGATNLRRVNAAPADDREIRAFIVPIGTNPPTTNVQDGMLFYSTAQTALMVRVSGAWKKIKAT